MSIHIYIYVENISGICLSNDVYCLLAVVYNVFASFFRSCLRVCILSFLFSLSLSLSLFLPPSSLLPSPHLHAALVIYTYIYTNTYMYMYVYIYNYLFKLRYVLPLARLTTSHDRLSMESHMAPFVPEDHAF